VGGGIFLAYEKENSVGELSKKNLERLHESLDKKSLLIALL